MLKIAGDALSKSWGNLVHHHHHLAYSTILEAVQRRGQQVQGPVDVGYQVRLRKWRIVLYGRQYISEEACTGLKTACTVELSGLRLSETV